MFRSIELAVLITSQVVAFSPTSNIKNTSFRRQNLPVPNANYQTTSTTSLSESPVATNCKPIFDFTGASSKEDKEKSVASFE
jgi:hypothetical protein